MKVEIIVVYQCGINLRHAQIFILSDILIYICRGFTRRIRMKKSGFTMLFIMVFIVTCFAGCKKSNDLEKVQLNEVAHSIFYAPQYAAIELGYFKDEGLDIKLVNGLGADKTMTAVLSGDADVGFMGSEASIYVYNEGKEDYVVNFAQLTQRAGNFLVSRDQNEKFTWDNVKGKTVIGGRAGGLQGIM